MEKTEKKKIKFFKRLKMAIFDIDKYIEFTSEKLFKSLGFMLKLSVILSFFIVLSYGIYVYNSFGSIEKCADKYVPEFSYQEKDLIIDEESAKEEPKKKVANLIEQFKPNIIQIMGDTTYTKNDLLNDIRKNEREIAIVVSLTMFFEYMLDVFLSWILVALLTSLIGVVNLGIAKVKMKYSKMFSLSVYASTLTTILTVLYLMGNVFLGVNIKSFDYLSMLISYIYITAVVYMIRSDLIKQQFELIKIATIQVKEQEKKKKEEQEKEKKKEEKDKDQEENKDKQEKKSGKEKEKKEERQVDNEPDGSEI